MKKYYIIVYGCQMNNSDSERIRAILNKSNFNEVYREDGADLIIVVACSIRQSAINRIYGKIPFFNRCKKSNPNFQTLITGCILDRDKKLFYTKFDFVLDIKEIEKIPELLACKNTACIEKLALPESKSVAQKLEQNPDYKIKNNFAYNYLKAIPQRTNNFSAILPIMTGCNNYCTYCVVPYVRGNKQSRPVEDILAEIRLLINNNYKEIWLLGQNVNDYDSSYDEQRYNFPILLKTIDEIIEKSGKKIWIRFTSPHPKNFSDELIDVIANGKNITNYINLPMQSGDNFILQKMNRGYTIEEYNLIVKKIRAKIPSVALSTDLILGFAGEEEANFKNTISAVKKNKFDMIYINQYSVRSGTAAEKFGDTVCREEKKKRWNILNSLLRDMSYQKNIKYLGKKTEVLVDSIIKDNYLGKTEDYTTVSIIKNKECRSLIGEFIKVKIIEIHPFGIKGTIVQN